MAAPLVARAAAEVAARLERSFYFAGIACLLAVAILLFMAFLAAQVSRRSGCEWDAFFRRPENFAAAGIFLFALASVAPHRRLESFPQLYRIFGALAALLVFGVAALLLAGVARDRPGEP